MSSDQVINNSIPVSNDVVLSVEQENIVRLVKEGRNVFITGSAGVGKSFLLQRVIKSLKNTTVNVTASTGVAACNVGGSTLHSFAGIGLGEKTAEHYGEMIRNRRYKTEVKNRWNKCQVLFIDEISMVDGNLFSKIENVARIVRNNPQPFGGIQVVLCGDFLQLPPVKSKVFAFETDAWKRAIKITVVLKKVFRQQHFGFVCLLNRLRVGYITSTDIEVLHHCRQTLFPDDGIKPTCLYPHRASCDELNKVELGKLSGEIRVFESMDFAIDEFHRKQIETISQFPKVLPLKIGAQVMLLHNIAVKSGLVNGARGVVIGFEDKSIAIQSDIDELSKPEYADDEVVFHEKVRLMERLKEVREDKSTSMPIVRFANNIEMAIPRQQHKVEFLGRTMASREQVPLALAWAVSVHKAQGVTLDRVELDIANVFEHGQGYVALSRVTSLDGLLLRAFDPNKITAHPKVLEYYKSVDPSFPQSTRDVGQEELLEFIEKRKDYESYKQEIDDQTRKEKELKLSISFEHSYSEQESRAESNSHHFVDSMPPGTPPTCSPSKSPSKVAVIDLTCDSPDNTSSSLPCKTDGNAPTTPSQFSSSHTDNTKTTPIRNNFLNSICPDLLSSAERQRQCVLSSQSPNTEEGRGQKRGQVFDSGIANKIHKKVEQHHQASSDDDKRMKALLKEKEASIQEKRRQALAKRYNSLQRSTMNRSMNNTFK